MPNWCFNYVHIKGNKTVLDKIRKEIKGGEEFPKLFRLFYPIPEELNYTIGHPPSKTDEEISELELEKKYGATDWYDWSIKNWGCKWDARDIEIEESGDDNLLYLRFDTPWSPPIDFYKNLANDYKVGLNATYTEEGMAFCGKFRSSVADGEVSFIDDFYDTEGIMDDILSRYIKIHKKARKQVTGEDFLNKMQSLYEKTYPEICEYYEGQEMFSEWWLGAIEKDADFCKKYGIINETTT